MVPICHLVSKPRRDLHPPWSAPPTLVGEPPLARLHIGGDLCTSFVVHVHRVPEGVRVETERTIYVLHGLTRLEEA